MGKLFHGGKHSGDFSRGLRPDDAGPGPETYSWSAPYGHALDAMARYPYGNCSGTQGAAGCSVRTWSAVSPEEEAEQPLEARRSQTTPSLLCAISPPSVSSNDHRHKIWAAFAKDPTCDNLAGRAG